jgi:hypothetical protein
MNNGCPTCRADFHQDIQSAFQGEGDNHANGHPVQVIHVVQQVNNNNGYMHHLRQRIDELSDANDRLREANNEAVDELRAEYQAKVAAENKLRDVERQYHLLLRDSSSMLQRACHTICDLQNSLKFACRAVRDSKSLNYEHVFYQHAVRTPRASFWQQHSVQAVKDRFPEIQDWFPTEDLDDVQLSVEVTAEEMRNFKIALKAEEQLLATLQSKDDDNYDYDVVTPQYEKVALMRNRLAAMVVPDSESAACDA